jgi:serine/threonine protein kinase
MSPEQISGVLSEKSDIWGIGVILYMMICNKKLAGKPPFYGKSIEETIDMITSTDVKFKGHIWNQVSYNLVTLISEMLEKNPKDRPTAEEALNSKWFSLTPN